MFTGSGTVDNLTSRGVTADAPNYFRLLDWNQRVLQSRQPRVSRTASTGHGSGTPFSS